MKNEVSGDFNKIIQGSSSVDANQDQLISGYGKTSAD